MSNEPVSRAEFDRVVDLLVRSVDAARDDLKGTMATGFETVNTRLDKMNGTQLDHTQRLAAVEAARGRVDVTLIISLLALLASAAAAYAAFH